MKKLPIMNLLLLGCILWIAGCNTAPSCFEVSFTDANLEQFVRIALGEFETDATITNCTLQDIETISTSEYVPIPEGSQIKDLSGIEHLINVTKISFSFNDIQDLSPLKNLTKLESLHLSQNEITDLTPLKNLKNLKKLFISANNIEDISALAQMTQLEWLILIENQIKDITPLDNLTSLTLLRLNQNQIEDLGALKALGNLNELNVSHNQIHDIDTIVEMSEAGTLPSTFSLDISNNPLSERALSVDVPLLQDRSVNVTF